MDNKFRSRKFMLAATSLALGSFFLSMGKIGGGEWVGLIAIILGLYGGSNVMEKRNES